MLKFNKAISKIVNSDCASRYQRLKKLFSLVHATEDCALLLHTLHVIIHGNCKIQKQVTYIYVLALLFIFIFISFNRKDINDVENETC